MSDEGGMVPTLGDPPLWVPAVCFGLGGGSRGMCYLDGVKGWLNLNMGSTVSWEWVWRRGVRMAGPVRESFLEEEVRKLGLEG